MDRAEVGRTWSLSDCSGFYEALRCKIRCEKRQQRSRNDGRKFPEVRQSSPAGVIPEVIPVCTFKEALEQAKQLDVILVPYECAEGMKETKNTS